MYFPINADPFALPPRKAIEAIGLALKKQYERWQPKVSNSGLYR